MHSLQGMGLSGAEVEETNEKMLQYLRLQHADVADTFFLTSDSIIPAATAFGEHEGIVLIAGTGSTCRFRKTDGLSTGGWMGPSHQRRRKRLLDGL